MGALEQSKGGQVPSPALQYIVDRVMVSAIRSQNQVSNDESYTAAGRDIQIQRLTVELNTFYSIEQLLRSPIVRAAVRAGLELQAGILNGKTGHVDFIGKHPALDAFMDEEMYS